MKDVESKTAVKDVESQTETEKHKEGKRPCHVSGELKKMLSKYCAPLEKEALLDLVVSMTKFERDGFRELLEDEMTDWLNNKWCDFPIEDKWEMLQRMKADPRRHFKDAEEMADWLNDWKMLQRMKANPRLNFEDAKVEDRDAEADVVENEDGTDFPSTGVAKLDKAIGGLAYDEIAVAHVIWELSQIDRQLSEKIGNALRILLKPLIETEHGWKKVTDLRTDLDTVIRVQWWLNFL